MNREGRGIDHHGNGSLVWTEIMGSHGHVHRSSGQWSALEAMLVGIGDFHHFIHLRIFHYADRSGFPCWQIVNPNFDGCRLLPTSYNSVRWRYAYIQVLWYVCPNWHFGIAEEMETVVASI